MNWFFIALIGPILYAVSNQIDKYILEKYFKAGEVGAITLFSSLFSVVALPIIYLMDPAVLSLGWADSLILTISGSLAVVCLILYLKALRDDEASTVVPFYQTIPIFGFILAYLFLGETLGKQEILAGILILIGTTIISLDFSKGGINLKKRVAALMLTASLLFAVMEVVFKAIALDQGFWPSIFWTFIGNIAIGIVIFITMKSYRQQFLRVFKINSGPVLLASSFNEIIFIIADGVSVYAILLAPVALVMVVNSFQPFFVFILGIFLTLFFPSIIKESLSKNIIAQKILAIGLITIGTWVLGMSGSL
jgi:drug/metabolite transporter (DMT)-like permease